MQLAFAHVIVTLLRAYADSFVAVPADFVMITVRVPPTELPKKSEGAPVAVAVAEAVVATRLRETVFGVVSTDTDPVELAGFPKPLAAAVKLVVLGMERIVQVPL